MIKPRRQEKGLFDLANSKIVQVQPKRKIEFDPDATGFQGYRFTGHISNGSLSVSFDRLDNEDSITGRDESKIRNTTVFFGFQFK